MNAPAAGGGADRCPRCGGGFSCGAAGPAPCPCGDLPLSPALQLQLRRQFSGCLCLPCLQALAAAERLDCPPIGLESLRLRRDA